MNRTLNSQGPHGHLGHLVTWAIFAVQIRVVCPWFGASRLWSRGGEGGGAGRIRPWRSEAPELRRVVLMRVVLTRTVLTEHRGQGALRLRLHLAGPFRRFFHWSPSSWARKKVGGKALEDLYQKKTAVEHVLLRPDLYIGSVNPTDGPVWYFDGSGMSFGAMPHVPGFLKIVDEILVNAADQATRDAGVTQIDVTVDVHEGSISVRNDGAGIPVHFHRKHKCYIPELIMGTLMTGTNFDDSEVRVTGGRMGYGAKLTNIFSSRFQLETYDAQRRIKYSQVWHDNMSRKEDPEIIQQEQDLESVHGNCETRQASAYTKITFVPDLSRFGMETIDAETLAVLIRRIYDIAGTCSSRRQSASTKMSKKSTAAKDLHDTLTVTFNGEPLPVNSFADYCCLYTDQHSPTMQGQGTSMKTGRTQSPVNKTGKDITTVSSLSPIPSFTSRNGRWQVCVLGSRPQTVASASVLAHVSFVNNMASPRGGTHVSHVADQLVKALHAALCKQLPNLEITPQLIRANLVVFVNALIENPAFDSQSKETLTTRPAAFGSTCRVPASLISDAVLLIPDQRRKHECRTLRCPGFRPSMTLGIARSLLACENRLNSECMNVSISTADDFDASEARVFAEGTVFDTCASTTTLFDSFQLPSSVSPKSCSFVSRLCRSHFFRSAALVFENARSIHSSSPWPS